MAEIKSNLIELEVVYSKLNKALDENINRLNIGAVAVDNYNKKISVVPSEFQKSLVDIKTKTDAVTQSTKQQVQGILDQSKALNSLEAQKQKELASLEKENAKLQASENLYNKVQAKLNSLSNEYKNLATRKELGLSLTAKEEKRYLTLQGRIQTYDKTLKAVDATMGKHQRNVGNYAASFDPLSNSINQLSREMPAFANSVQTGFMAISNNLPTFFDSIQGIIDQNKELQAAGEPTESVLSKITDSLFSVQTLLSVGVTLLTVYGKDIVNAFLGGTNAVDEFEKNIKGVNEIFTEQAEKLKIVKQVLNDTNSTQKQYSEALRIAKENGISLNAVEQARKGNLELINSELDKNVKISIAKAKVDRLIALATEEEIKRYNLVQENIKAEKSGFSFRNIEGLGEIMKDQANAEIKASQRVSVEYENRIKKLLEYIDIDEETTGKSLKNLKRLQIASQDYFASDFENRKRVLELNIEANEKTLKDDKESFNNRFIAEQNYYNLKNALLELEYQEEIRLQKKAKKDELANIKESYLNQLAQIKDGVSNGKEARIQAENEKNKAILFLEKDNKNKLELIEINHNQKILDLTESQINSIVDAKEKLTQKTGEENIISAQTLDSLRQLIEIRKQLNSKSSIKVFEDLEKQKTKIEQEEVFKRLEIDKLEVEEKLSNFELYKLGSLEREELEKQYLEVKKKIFEETSKLDEQQIKKQKELTQLLEDTYKGFIDDFSADSGFSKMLDIMGGGLDKFEGDAKAVALTVSEAFQEAFNTISEASQANYDAEYERLEAQKEISMQFAGESTAAKEEIERQYEEKRKSIARREAEAQKRLAIFNIATNTAQAIMATYAKLGFPKGLPFAIAVGAIGAAQIAMVSAQEIPQFWRGTENAPEGWALTQERGAEVITDKYGKVKTYGTDKGAQMTYLSKGDKVYNAQKSEAYINNELAKNGIMPMRQSIINYSENNGLSKDDFNNGISKLAKTIKNGQPTNNTQVFLNNKQINTDYYKGKNV